MAASQPVSKLTPQQSAAITTRNVSVALSAGAGCGKTFVLTERFLSCLDPSGPDGGLRLDQITAITFTERAAREMRARIRSACAERLLAAPEAEVERWLRTVRALDSARVSTIHSFCGSLLRAHAVEARLDPQFAVLDGAEADTLLFETIDDRLRERLSRRDEATIQLVVRFRLDGLREMVQCLLANRQSINWDHWRNTSPAALVERWEAYWKKNSLPRVLATIGKSPAAVTILAILGDEMPDHATMGQRAELLCEKLPRVAEGRIAPAELAEIREAAKVQGGGGKKVWSSEEVFDDFSAAAKSLRALIDQCEKELTFDAVAARPAAEMAMALMAVAEDVATAYAAGKNEMASLDFDDLLIRARALLTSPQSENLRKRLASQTQLLLVDEFQDTDPLQVELVRSLVDGQVAGGKLFFVGDYKQSIYRFRGADPHVFRQLREEIPVEGRLPLSRNFRSQPAILDFVNALFCDELGPHYEALTAQRKQVSPQPAVEFLWAIEDVIDEKNDSIVDQVADISPSDVIASETIEQLNADDRSSRSERTRRREADWVARRIRAMLDKPEQIVWDVEAAKRGQPAPRDVRPGDITLLFRALTNVEFYEDALHNYGIEYYLVGGHAFYAQQEIYDVVNLLRTIVSPADEVSLIGTLRSPMFSLWDETLYWLAQHPHGLAEGLFTRSRSASYFRSIDRDQLARVNRAAETLTALRAMKDRIPIARLLQEAIHRTGYDAVLLAEFLGERKLANLHKLVDQARSFDASGFFGLSDFIVRLSQFVAQQPDEPLAATQPESINAVRLMSIHQSKGLEFPVVFVVDFDRARRMTTHAAAFSPDLGPMVRMSEVVSGFDLFVREELEEELEELKRLLYVATTRAADYLVLSAGMPELDSVDSAKGPWFDLLRRRFDPRTGVALKSTTTERLAKVTTERPKIADRPNGKSSWVDLNHLADRAEKLAAEGKGILPPLVAPIEPKLAARRHFSVSRLKSALDPIELEPPIARLASDDDELAAASTPWLDPRDLGTLVHAVLAEFAIGSARNASQASEAVARHANSLGTFAKEALSEATDLVERFLTSPRFAAIQAAQHKHVELEFLLAWPPGSESFSQDCPYLQGFIDCLYNAAQAGAASGWRIIDYKTNQLSPGDEVALAKEYEMQMLTYGLAVEQILGQPPAELVLHFLRTGSEATIAWTSASRRRAIAWVEERIALLRGGQSGEAVG